MVVSAPSGYVHDAEWCRMRNIKLTNYSYGFSGSKKHTYELDTGQRFYLAMDAPNPCGPSPRQVSIRTWFAPEIAQLPQS